jgi:hypothetical protein
MVRVAVFLLTVTVTTAVILVLDRLRLLAVSVAIALEALLRAEALALFLGATITEKSRFVEDSVDQIGIGVALAVGIDSANAEHAPGNCCRVSFEILSIIASDDLDQVLLLILLNTRVTGSELGANGLGQDQMAFAQVFQLEELHLPTVKDGEDIRFTLLAIASELKNNTNKRVLVTGSEGSSRSVQINVLGKIQ